MIDFLLLCSVPIVFVMGFRRPDRAVLTWLGLSPFAHSNTIFFDINFRIISYDRLCFVAMFLTLYSNGTLPYVFRRPFSNLERAFLAFIAVFFLEALVSFPVRDALSAWTAGIDLFVIPCFLYFLIKYLLLHSHAGDLFENQIAKTLAATCVISAAMGIFEHFSHFDLMSRGPMGLREAEFGSVRANGPFGVPEVLGQYLSFTLLFWLYRWRVNELSNVRARWQGSFTRLAFALVMLGGIYSTMFRNVWGGFLGGVGLQYLLTREGRKKLLIIGFVCAIAGGIAWPIISRTEVYQHRVSNVENIHDRLNAWLYAFRAFSEHPFVGIGYGQLKRYIHEAQSRGDDLRFFEDIAATYHPHNTIIGLLGENGILLTVPCLLILYHVLRTVQECRKRANRPEETVFALFAAGGAFAMLAPHMSDRCLQWDKYNNLLLVFLSIVAVHHTRLMNPPPSDGSGGSIQPAEPSGDDAVPISDQHSSYC